VKGSILRKATGYNWPQKFFGLEIHKGLIYEDYLIVSNSLWFQKIREFGNDDLAVEYVTI